MTSVCDMYWRGNDVADAYANSEEADRTDQNQPESRLRIPV